MSEPMELLESTNCRTPPNYWTCSPTRAWFSGEKEAGFVFALRKELLPKRYDRNWRRKKIRC